ncbi:hypothetical protein [Catellatospora vulcania]|uniref:hypothetical protein n=1 Tax=Catellatospora vulcania TaxID=1460450 RepID=UPI0012D45CBC|nr:hypothetical protein [Catellatospora vulcania]
MSELTPNPYAAGEPLPPDRGHRPPDGATPGYGPEHAERRTVSTRHLVEELGAR